MKPSDSEDYYQGTAKGIILKSNNPINFLGAVDKKLESSEIKAMIFLTNQLRTPF